MANLTDRQLAFCEEYLIDLNATQAAIRAGYSDKNAKSQAARLLMNADVQQGIQELKAQRSKRTEITADFVLQQLVAIASSHITDVVNVVNECVEREDGSFINVPYVVVKDTEELTEAQKASIASIKQTRNGIEVKMHDKVATLKLIGDHLGMFNATKDSNVEFEDDGFMDALREGAKAWHEE